MPVKKPRLPILFKWRKQRTVLDYFNSLSTNEKEQFIKEHLTKHRKSGEIAKRILQSHPEMHTAIREKNLDYELRELEILNYKRKMDLSDRDALNKQILVWFENSNIENRYRILENDFYGANPELFKEYMPELCNYNLIGTQARYTQLMQNYPKRMQKEKEQYFKRKEKEAIYLRKTIIPANKKTFDNFVLNWFRNSDFDYKLRILDNNLYSADPEQFIDETVKTYRETKDSRIISRLIRITKGSDPLVKRGYLQDLIDADFTYSLIGKYYKEIADLGHIIEIIRDNSKVKNLVNIDIHGNRKYLKQIADVGIEGINCLINNGFGKQLFETKDYQSKLIHTLGQEKYIHLRDQFI